MKYMVYDLETQTHEYTKRKASPWHPDNYIVAAGWKVRGDEQASYDYMPTQGKYFLKIPKDIKLLVGFNLKFDLLWQWDNPELKAFFKRGGKIWDCQYVEYLLAGQDARFQWADLGSTAVRYGGTKKIDEVKILWDAGVQTSDIDKDLLIDYLVGTEAEGRNGGDIGNTERVFKGQVARVKAAGMLTGIWSRMDGLCSTTEMEWNGLQIDIKEAKKQYSVLTDERKSLSLELDEYIQGLPEEFEFNWGSGVHKSCIIFGGTVAYEKRDTYIDLKTGELARLKAEEAHWLLDDGTTSNAADPPLNTLKFKSGKNVGEYRTKKVRVQGPLKQKLVTFYHEFPGYTPPTHAEKTKLTDAANQPVYSTSGENIEALEHTGVPFCKTISRYESVNKEINTYFVTKDKQGNSVGMLTCVDPLTNVIHHNLNHVSTVTSRLSAERPNMQNIPRSDKSSIKRLFVSRFGVNGSMGEADYSQLEVVVQGVLTKDKKLLKDLNNSIDFHCKRVALQTRFNITYERIKSIIKDESHPEHAIWKAHRTHAKIFSFQRAYGAGAKKIALTTGMRLEDVQALIEAEELEYPGIKAFNDNVAKDVADGATWFKDPSYGFQAFRRGYWTSPTGCMYHFRSYPAQDWQRERGILESFSPTEMKNYPIQGTGGEIVQGTIGMLWRHFVANDNYGGLALLCNTVHDCVWFDAHNDVIKQVCADVKRIMESVDVWFNKFGVDITVPFPVEVEVGPNMLDLSHA